MGQCHLCLPSSLYYPMANCCLPLPLLCFAAASAGSAITLLLAAAAGISVSCCLLLLLRPLGGMHV